MTDWMAYLEGTFQIEFVGGKIQEVVVIETVIRDSYGHPIYLIGPNETIYNWSTIIRMIRRN